MNTSKYDKEQVHLHKDAIENPKTCSYGESYKIYNTFLEIAVITLEKNYLSSEEHFKMSLRNH